MKNEIIRENLNKIKEVSKVLLHVLPIEEADVGMGIASHPFTNNVISALQTADGFKMIDLRIEKEQKEWIKIIEERINKADNIIKIYMMINKPYILLWLKLIKPYLTKKVFSEYLKDAWVRSENPNQDVNVKINEITEWFKDADKKALMNKDEYSIWEKCPKTIKLYRGVGKDRALKGLSWTDNFEKAEWFANRWGHHGNVYMIEAKKEDVLCYFEGEMEYVINPQSYKMTIANKP